MTFWNAHLWKRRNAVVSAAAAIAVAVLSACQTTNYSIPTTGLAGPLKPFLSEYAKARSIDYNATPETSTNPVMTKLHAYRKQIRGSIHKAVWRDGREYYLDGYFYRSAEAFSTLALTYMLEEDFEEAAKNHRFGFEAIQESEADLIRAAKHNQRQRAQAMAMLSTMLSVASVGMPSQSRVHAMRASAIAQDLSTKQETADARKSFSGADLPESTAKRALIAMRSGTLQSIVRVRNRNGGWCTGAQILPGGYVVTNAHCVHDGSGKRRRASDLTVEVAEPHYTATFGVTGITAPRDYDGARFDSGFPKDWAILELNYEIPTTFLSTGAYWEGDKFGATPAPLEILSNRPDKPKAVLAGYSGDLNDGRFISADLGCDWTYSKRDKVIYHNCESWKGSSGSPFYVPIDGKLKVIGINAGVRGERGVAVPIAAFSGNWASLFKKPDKPAVPAGYPRRIPLFEAVGATNYDNRRP